MAAKKSVAFLDGFCFRESFSDCDEKAILKILSDIPATPPRFPFERRRRVLKNLRENRPKTLRSLAAEFGVTGSRIQQDEDLIVFHFQSLHPETKEAA